MIPYLQRTNLCYLTTTLYVVVCLGANSSQNAATFYQLAFKNFKPLQQDDFTKLDDFADGKTEADIETHRLSIKYPGFIEEINAASAMPYCDWEYSPSDGDLWPIPISWEKAKQLGAILIANARLLEWKGDSVEGIQQCLLAHKVSLHFGNHNFLSHMFGMAMRNQANKAIVDLMSSAILDEDFLIQLDNELEIVLSSRNTFQNSMEKTIPSMRSEFQMDKKAFMVKRFSQLKHWVPKEKSKVVEEAFEQCKGADASFFEQSWEHFVNYMTSVINVSNEPFEQAYEMLNELSREQGKIMFENAHAFLTSVTAPSTISIYCRDVSDRTFLNLLRVAIAIYRMKIYSGRLPDKLPDGLPNDLYSDRDFMYKKTEQGFLLSFEEINSQRKKVTINCHFTMGTERVMP